MTGLYVIVSGRRQAQLSSRRNGYRHVALDGAHGYVREDHNSGFLGTREGDRVRMSSQWLADIGAVADDPGATFFFVECRYREPLPDAIRRGLALPVGKADDPALRVDAERRRAADQRPHAPHR